MAVEIFMPRLTHDMDTGVIVRWLKKEGQAIKTGDDLLEIETNKAVTILTAEQNGILGNILFSEGDSVPIGTTIAYLFESDAERIAHATGGIQSAVSQEEKGNIKVPSSRVEINETQKVSCLIRTFHRNIASPLAKRMAREEGVDLSKIVGSGPTGRVVQRDVLAFLNENQPTQSCETSAAYTLIQPTTVKRITAQRMLESIRNQPSFVLELDANMENVSAFRASFNQMQDARISFTSIFIRAITKSLQQHPVVNASYGDDGIHQYHDVNLGVAMAAPQGLVVPVFHKAQEDDLLATQQKLNGLREKAQNNRLSLAELEGGTFTFSNLGMYGIDRFTAIINPPQAAILAFGRIHDIPWNKDGEIKICPILTMRLTVDHRVLDGAAASGFLVALRDILENPYLLIC